MKQEEKNVKLFWKPVDSNGVQELKDVTKTECLEISEDSVDMEHFNTPATREYSFSFTKQITEKEFRSIYRMFKGRLPRKFKKRYKNMVAKKFGIKPSKLRFRYTASFSHE